MFASLFLAFAAARAQATPPAPGVGQSAPPVSTALPGKYVAPPPGAGSAVAKVDGQLIFGHDVEALLWESLGPQAVEDLVSLVMVRRAAEKEDIHVTQAEVEARLKEDVKMYDERTKSGQQARPEGMTVTDYLAKQGYPLSRLYLNTEIEVTLDKMAERTFRPDAYLKVSLMLFKPDAATPAAITKAQQNADAAVKRMRAGGKWHDELAKSQMPAEYINVDGSLGWLDSATFPPDVAAQLKKLKAGEFTDPIKITSQGSTSFQVFRLDEVGGKATAAELATIKTRYLQGQHSNLLNSIRSSAKVDLFPTTEPGAVTPPVTSPPAKK